MKVIPFLFLFVTLSLSAQPTTWNSSTTYSTGNIVVSGSSTYIAVQNVPANTDTSNSTYWEDLANAASQLGIPVETVPNLNSNTILDALPGQAPDANSSAKKSKISVWVSGKVYQAASIVISGSNTYLAKIEVPIGIRPPNVNYWDDLNEVALRMGIPIDAVPKISTEKILKSIPVRWDIRLGYKKGSIVVRNGNSYIAKMDVPIGQDPEVSSYWTNLANAAVALKIPVESVPTLSVNTILSSLPGKSSSSKTSGIQNSVLSVWDNAKGYRKGELVIFKNKTYLAKKTVPAGQNPPSASFWLSLSEAATQLKVPIHVVPKIDTATILASLPNAPPTSTQHKIFLSSSPEKAGDLSGGGEVARGSMITISANPRPGYLFKEWKKGSLLSTSPKDLFMVSEDLNVTAYFKKDLGDDDADGLSNYQELSTYGTNKDSNDSDSDGFSDAFEVEIGTNPLVSDSRLVNYISENPTKFSLVEKAKYDQAMNAYPAQDTNSTPYTNDWFYLPNRGWMWTNSDTYPYFFDQNTSDWLHFENGNSKPTFYEYKTKKWIRIE